MLFGYGHLQLPAPTAPQLVPNVMNCLLIQQLKQRKGRGEERVAKLQDSPDCPEREATYIITNGFVVYLTYPLPFFVGHRY